MSTLSCNTPRLVSSRHKWRIAILFMIIALCFPITVEIDAQPSCLTPEGYNNEEYDETIRGLDEEGPFYLRIYTHVIRRSDGSGGQSFEGVEQALSYLDDAFYDHNIFFTWDCYIHYIDDDDYYDDPYVNGLYSTFSLNNHYDGIDIYLFDNSLTNANGLANGIGMGSEFLVHGHLSNYGPLAQSHFMSHEMGHVLNLYHTHANCEPLGPEDVVELADGSNCAYAGDRCCDTPVDPGLHDRVDPVTCEWDETFGLCSVNLLEPLGGFNPDAKNIMSYSWLGCREYFSPDQGQRMRNSIATLPHLQAAMVDVNSLSNYCYCIKNDVVLNGTHSYSGDEIINGNLILQAGADVLVTGTLRFPYGYGINVERGARLKVEGGLLTVACDHHHWEGITVEGNGSLDQPNIQNMPTSNEAGVVILTQGATIEKAGIAINTIHKSGSWDENYWGGLVFAQNAFFKDCYRAAAFMKYRPYVGHLNKSRFIDCDIRGTGNYWPNSTGITIWATDGIEFRENTFEDIKRSGLLVYDAYAEVFHDNVFEGNQFGITGIASAPFMGSMIIGKSSTGTHRNVFRDNYVHVHASGMQHPGKGKYTVANNDFFNGLAAVWLDGTNSYNVRRNSFLNQTWSGLSYNTGFDFNKIECNTFHDNNLGIGFQGINSEAQFLENSFINNTWTDVNLYGTMSNLGVIRDFQGTAGWPAENCFTVEKIPVVTSGNTTLFNYLIETSTPLVSCKRPICNLSDGCSNPNHYVVDYTLNQLGSRCGLPDPSIPTEPNFHQMDSLLVYWTDEYLADTTDMTAHINMVEYGSLRQDALFHQVGFYANMQQDSLLIDLLVQEGTPYAERLLYGYYLQSDRFTEASTLLMDMLQSTSVEDQQFATIQQINLAFYQSPATFTLDSIQTQLLWDAAESEYGDRAWARSMLTYHLDAAFYPEVVAEPRFAEGLATPQQINLWKVYPNPAQDVLLIELLEGVEKDHLRFQVMDLLGRVVITQQGSGTQTTMQLDGLKAGTYILGIHSDGNTPEYHKFQIQK